MADCVTEWVLLETVSKKGGILGNSLGEATGPQLRPQTLVGLVVRLLLFTL